MYSYILFFVFGVVFGLAMFLAFVPREYWLHLGWWLWLTLKDVWGLEVKSGIYPFFSATRFFHVLTNHRMCYIRGALGSGKSTLAAWLCAFLLTFRDEFGRVFAKRVASNIPHRWPRPTLSQGCDMSVIWFDELGLFVDSRAWAKTDNRYWAGLRKLRSVIIGSSRVPVDKRLAELWVQRTTDFPFNRLTNAWFFLWGYESGDERDGGMFFVYRPQTIWEFYPTYSYPTSPGGVLDLLDISIDRAEALGVEDYLAYDFEEARGLPHGVSAEVKDRWQKWQRDGRPSFDYFSSQFYSFMARWQVLKDCQDLDKLEARVLLDQVGKLHDQCVSADNLEVAEQIRGWYVERKNEFGFS